MAIIKMLNGMKLRCANNTDVSRNYPHPQGERYTVIAWVVIGLDVNVMRHRV